MDFLNILAISPHTDDAELGCGGTLHKFCERYHNVIIYGVCAPSKQLEDEFYKSARIIGARPVLGNYPRRRFSSYRQEILDEFIHMRDTFEPDIVFLPGRNDLHQDHYVVYNEGIRAFKYDMQLYSYEQPWNQFTCDGLAYSILKHANMDAKLEALFEYDSQKDKHYFDPMYVTSLARVRGANVKAKYAEAFYPLRCFI